MIKFSPNLKSKLKSLEYQENEENDFYHLGNVAASVTLY